MTAQGGTSAAVAPACARLAVVTIARRNDRSRRGPGPPLGVDRVGIMLVHTTPTDPALAACAASSSQGARLLPGSGVGHGVGGIRAGARPHVARAPCQPVRDAP